MTRNRIALSLLAGLALLVAGPALADDGPTPLEDVTPVLEYPKPFSVISWFEEREITVPTPPDHEFPAPIPLLPGGGDQNQGSESARSTRPGGQGVIGSSLVGAPSGSGLSRPDLEGIIRTARRTLDG